MRMYRSRTWVVALATSVVAAAGCATAKPGTVGEKPDATANTGDPDAMVIAGRPDAEPIPDAAPGTPDAPPPPDAAPPPPDAPITGGTITLSQTSSSTVTANNSVGCGDQFYDTAENSFYRAFVPASSGASGTFHVTHVDFGIDGATAGLTGSQSVTVKLYSYTGATGTTLDTTMMTPLGSKTVNVPDTTTTEMLSANISASLPATSTLVAEVFIPDGENEENYIYMGTNTGGESAPGYIRAPSCSTPTPTAISSLGLGREIDVVLTVTGSYP
jgi:hypothetical protein